MDNAKHNINRRHKCPGCRKTLQKIENKVNPEYNFQCAKCNRRFKITHMYR